MFEYNDKSIKVKNINGKYFAVHYYTEKIVYNPYTGYKSKLLSRFTKSRLQIELWKAIKLHKQIEKRGNMYRIGILKADETNEAHNFDTKEECENWLLEIAEKYAVKKAVILNSEDRNDREVINF